MKEGVDKHVLPWESTGLKSLNSSFKSDGKKTVKGTLVYDVEFYPCSKIKNISFEAPPSKLDEVVTDEVANSGSIAEISPGGDAEVDEELARDIEKVQSGQIKGAALQNGDVSRPLTPEVPLSSTPTSENKPDEGVELSKEQILSSGKLALDNEN
jgi:hypothetical protein